MGMIGLATADVEIVQRAATIAAQAGNQAGVPSLLWTVAEIHRHHGRRDEALAAVEAGLQLGSATGQLYNRSALTRMKGEVLLIDADPSGGEPAREAEACFRQAIEIARGHDAGSQELRAALRLSQLLSTAGRNDEARRVLESVYEGFDEGLDCADLVEAREHLAALGR